MPLPLSSSKILAAAAVVATVLGTASVTNAAIISNSAPVSSPTIVPVFTKFNPALGTLTGATITISLNLHPSEVEINATAPVGTPFTITLNSLVFSDTDPNSAVTSKTYDFTGDPVDYTAIGTAGAAGSKQTFAAPSVTFSSTTVITAANLSTYVGILGNVGTITPSFSDTAKGTVTAVGPGQGLTSSTSFDGTATITYTYTPSPEPASLSLLALSSAGLLLRRRRQL